MSRASVARALQERAERLAKSAWTGAKTGAEGAYRAGAGIVGAPQGPSQGSSQGSYDNMANYRDAIAAVESRGSGDYQARGPRTRSGDRAYGRYQVMGANIPSWTQQALGYQMTPQQFLADQSAQDKVFDTVFGGYLGRGSPQDAISRWFTGQPLAVGKYRADVNGMTGNRYVDKVMANLGQSAGGSISRRGAEVAALQKNLISLGANLKVDGLEGPRTRAAMQQFMGSPTSVRTPSFTAKAYMPGSPGLTLGAGLSSPYVNSTGGANAIAAPRRVPTVAVQSDVRSKSPLPSYYDSQTAGDMTTAGGRAVPTAAGYGPTTGPVLTGGFSPPRQAPVPQTPSFMNPYTMSTGGARAIVQPAQTARMPQHRPAYPPPSLPAPAGPTLWQQAQEAARRTAEVGAQIAERARQAAVQGTRSGMGYSGGGGYTGGSYGGAGGRSISSGVGGAFRNR